MAKGKGTIDWEAQASDNRKRFSEPLLVWYDRHKRDLPWRRTSDPYHIWISEVMLQQTRVDTVIPYFERFVERFPTVAKLAQAPEEEVLKHWEGLGYYSRARNLQAAVREVHERYGGLVPDRKEHMVTLKGVGPYTAGAVLSIAYNVAEPAVDGNVMRVLSRNFCLEDDIAKPATRVHIEQLAQSLIPEGRAGDFNQALMELGATVCTPRSPLCLTCPVMAFCKGREAGRELELPVKTKAKAPKPEQRSSLLIEGTGRYAGHVLVRQRPPRGLLARMWELPHALARPKGDVQEELRASLIGGQLVNVKPWMRASHTFSHLVWEMDVATCELDGVDEVMLPAEFRWITREALAELAFPQLFLRILQAYWDVH